MLRASSLAFLPPRHAICLQKNFCSFISYISFYSINMLSYIFNILIFYIIIFNCFYYYFSCIIENQILKIYQVPLLLYFSTINISYAEQMNIIKSVTLIFDTNSHKFLHRGIFVTRKIIKWLFLNLQINL